MKTTSHTEPLGLRAAPDDGGELAGVPEDLARALYTRATGDRLRFMISSWLNRHP